MPTASSYRPIRARAPGTPFSSSSHRRTAAAAAVRLSAATASSRWASSSAGSGTARCDGLLRMPMMPHMTNQATDSRPGRSVAHAGAVSAETSLHQVSESVCRRLSHGLARSLDHHADQGLRPARAHENAALAAQRRCGCSDFVGELDIDRRVSIGNPDVDEDLGVRRHDRSCQVGQSTACRTDVCRQSQSREQAIARRRQVPVDDVPALLAADRIVAGLECLQARTCRRRPW